MNDRNNAKKRRQARRLARKLFKSGVKQPPEVFVAYLTGLARGAELRELQEQAIRDIPLMDIFGQRVSGLGSARSPDERAARKPAVVYH